MHPLKTVLFLSEFAKAASGVFLRFKAVWFISLQLENGFENALQLKLRCLEFSLKSVEFECLER